MAAPIPDQQAYVEPDRDDIILPDEPWSDSFAVKVVASDFNSASNYRFQNHDWRWRQNEERFIGWMPQRYWEGTRIPRANIQMHVILEQVEALLPRILSEIFRDDPWFDAMPMRGTTPEATRKVRDIIQAQLESEYCNIHEVMRRGIKSELIYGNGIYTLEWMHSEEEVLRYLPEFTPQKKSMPDPRTGQMVSMPTGKTTRKIREFKMLEVINQPVVRWVSLFDFYLDPNCPGPMPKESRFVIQRCLMTVDDVAAMSKADGFNIPDKEVLAELAQNKFTVEGDQTKGYVETSRIGQWNPIKDESADPASKRLEVLKYWTKTRCVWVANRTTVIYNKPNPLGFIPFYSSFHTDLIDRFYAMGIGDILEGEQLLQAGVINARVDELALSIHPMIVHRQGRSVPPYKLRIRPGAVVDSENPKDDMQTRYPQNVTQQAFMEVEASSNRAQKATGVTDLAMMGTSQGNNPGARTATGAGLQGQASASRAQYHVENIETNVLEPILADIQKLNERYLDPDQIIEALDGSGIEAIDIFGARVKMKMRAGTRMQSRQSLLQMLPVIMPVLGSPQLQEQLARKGQTIDLVSLFEMIYDASGYRSKATLIRKLTPEEQQALNQPNPNDPNLIKERMQDKRMESMANMNFDDAQLKLLHDIVLHGTKTGLPETPTQ